VLQTVELETGRSPTAAVIWLHGLGADGHDFEPIVPELDLPDALAVRFVFPHAPMQAVTINGGAVMRAWYDVYALEGQRREDAAGVRASQSKVEELIAREQARGIPSARLVLAGFSQGGAIALQTGLRHGERLAGIMALSTYLPVASTLAAEASAANRAVPIFMAHGLDDPLIPIERAAMSRRQLEAAGYAIEWHE
jgi:phospholipase/carboxylesterase